MDLLGILKNSHTRIAATHILVIVVIALNMMLFTTNTGSLLIQAFLIIAVWLHHRDDKHIKEIINHSQEVLKADSDIFNRNIIISESDLDGIITYVNSKFCTMTGYAEYELIGQPHSILRDPQTPKEFYKQLWDTIENGHTFHAVFKNLKKDGTYFWSDTSIFPKLVGSNVVGYKAIRLDITDQMLVKEGLKNEINEKDNFIKEQSNRFEFIINSSRDGFWDYDLLKKDFYLNSGWKKRLGFNENDDLTYLNYLSLIPDEIRFEHHHAMHDMLEEYNGDVEYVHFRIRYPIVTKAGEKIMIEDVGNAFFDENKLPVRITGFHRDITEQERQNKIIESQNRMAEMGEMIGNIAHQWRQPIGAINNILNDIEIGIELDDATQMDVKTFLDTSKKVKEYTKYLSQTIDDFRNISSNDKVKSDFYIKGVLEEAYKLVLKSYETNKIKFQIIEFGEQSCQYNGYHRELLQIVLNILNNAKDIFIEKSVNNPQVLVTLIQKNDEAIITIHDNAGGVPESIKDKIFNPYFTTKHESVGTGIGLYMSKKMIGEHFNGTLMVENEGDGAKFIITMPIDK